MQTAQMSRARLEIKVRQTTVKIRGSQDGLTVLFASTRGREVASCAGVRVRTVAELLLDGRQSINVRVCGAGVGVRRVGGRGLEWEGLKVRGRGPMTTPPRG